MSMLWPHGFFYFGQIFKLKQHKVNVHQPLQSLCLKCSGGIFLAHVCHLVMEYDVETMSGTQIK